MEYMQILQESLKTLWSFLKVLFFSIVSSFMVLVNYIMIYFALVPFFEVESLLQNEIFGPILQFIYNISGIYFDVSASNLFALVIAIAIFFGLFYIFNLIRQLLILSWNTLANNSLSIEQRLAQETHWWICAGYAFILVIFVFIAITMDIYLFFGRLCTLLVTNTGTSLNLYSDITLSSLRQNGYIAGLLVFLMAGYIAVTIVIATLLDKSIYNFEINLLLLLDRLNFNNNNLPAQSNSLNSTSTNTGKEDKEIEARERFFNDNKLDDVVRVQGVGKKVTVREIKENINNYYICANCGVFTRNYFNLFGCSCQPKN